MDEGGRGKILRFLYLMIYAVVVFIYFTKHAMAKQQKQLKYAIITFRYGSNILGNLFHSGEKHL